MPHRITHVLDTAVVMIVSSFTTIAALLTSSDVNDLRMLLLPLLGALIVSGGMIMLNPCPETRRIVIGRGIFALFFGAIGPQLIAMLHPSLQSLSAAPVVLLFEGGIASAMAYVLSKPFTRQMYERADRVAAREAERLERKYSPGTEEHTIIIKDRKPVEPIDPSL